MGEERETYKMQLIWCLLSNFISTCFGHHCSHHQKNNSMNCRIWCSAMLVMAVAVWSWDACCMHCEIYCEHYFSPDDGNNDARNMLR